MSSTSRRRSASPDRHRRRHRDDGKHAELSSSRRRSRDRDRDRDREWDRDERKSSRRKDYSSSPEPVPPEEQISEDDFFLKSAEFRSWLKDDRGKYFTDLDGETARHYFRKFVKKWNRGQLDPELYKGPPAVRSSAVQSRHAWSFKGTTQKELASVRAEQEAASTSFGPTPSSSRRTLGPSLPPPSTSSSNPSLSDIQLAREAAADAADAARGTAQAARRQDRREARELTEELAPRATGREAAIEKRKEANAVNRSMRERSPGGLEMDEGFLMGGDSFAARVAARDAARERKSRGKQDARAERAAEMDEKRAAYRAKEDATMAMFKDLAKARFG